MAHMNIIQFAPSAAREQKRGDYHLKLTVKNGLLLKAILDEGYKTQTDFARHAKIPPNSLYAILAMKLPARNKKGGWTLTALRIADALHRLPDQLFNEQQAKGGVKTNTFEAFTDVDGLNRLSCDGELAALESKITLEQISNELTDRERDVVLRHADGESFAEIAKDWDVGKGRITQINAKAIRKLKYAARLKQTWGELPIRHIEGRR